MESIDPGQTTLSPITTVSMLTPNKPVWTPTSSQIEKMAFHNTFVAPDHTLELEDNPICKAVLQILTGRKYITQSDTDKPLDPSSLGGTTTIEHPHPLDAGMPVTHDCSLAETSASYRLPTLPENPEKPFFYNPGIISKLKALNGRKVTAKLEYVNSNLSAGVASFSIKEIPHPIQILFIKDVTSKRLPASILQKDYVITGKLVFNDHEMSKRIATIPPRFLKEAPMKYIAQNSVSLAPGSIRFIKKGPRKEHLMNFSNLTKSQQRVFNTITSLYNQQLDADVVSLKGKPELKIPLEGQACLHLSTGQLLFIHFIIPVTKIASGVDSSVYLKRGNIRGTLRYDKGWLFSQILNNSILLHSSPPKKLRDINRIYFLSNSISLSFRDKTTSNE